MVDMPYMVCRRTAQEAVHRYHTCSGAQAPAVALLGCAHRRTKPTFMIASTPNAMVKM